MKEKVDVVRGWLRKATSDFVSIGATIEAGSLEAACFHPQQAAEKYLKGFLAFHDRPFPYTHNLADLTELCADIDDSFHSLTAIASELTPYAVRLRSDDSFWPTLETAEQAQASSLAIRDGGSGPLPTTADLRPLGEGSVFQGRWRCGPATKIERRKGLTIGLEYR
jgi:HEPN domain-containing protein